MITHGPTIKCTGELNKKIIKIRVFMIITKLDVSKRHEWPRPKKLKNL